MSEADVMISAEMIRMFCENHPTCDDCPFLNKMGGDDGIHWECRVCGEPYTWRVLDGEKEER